MPWKIPGRNPKALFLGGHSLIELSRGISRQGYAARDTFSGTWMDKPEKKQILIAGGSKPAQLSLLEFFPRDEYEVTFASAGGETVFRTINGNPDLLIMDPSFGDMSGPEVISKIRDFSRDMESVVTTKEVPIIIVHGADLDSNIIHKTKMLRVAATVCRPLVRQDFIEMVRDVFSGFDESGAFSARTILVIEPEPRVRTLYQNILAYSDEIEVITVAECKEALEKVEVKRPDLVVCEQELPDMTGIEFVGKLREIEKDIPIIMVTAVGDEAFIKEAKEAGVTEYVKKPFKLDELKGLIRESLDNSPGHSDPAGSPAAAVAENPDSKP